MHANQREERDEFYTGDIAACIGLEKGNHRRYALLAEASASSWRKWNSLNL